MDRNIKEQKKRIREFFPKVMEDINKGEESIELYK